MKPHDQADGKKLLKLRFGFFLGGVTLEKSIFSVPFFYRKQEIQLSKYTNKLHKNRFS